MKKYEIYKDSGFEWIGEIPEGWEVSRIKHLLEQSKDGIKIGPFGSALTGKVNNEGEYKVYGQWNIVGKDFNAGKNFVSSETFSALESYHISSGDLFISMMGTVGKCAIIPKGVAPGIMDSHVVKARLDETKMLPKYFEYVYDKDNSNVIYSQIQKYRKGSIMDGLNSTLIKEFVVPFPSLSEQRTIISYLDHKVGQIDASVSAINAQIDDLKAYRQSIISEAVTKGLNPDTKMKDSGIEWIGEIPEGWETSKLKFESKMVLGKMLEDKEPKDNKGEYTQEYYLKSRNIGMLEVFTDKDKLDKMWFSNKEKELYLLQKGDLVMNEGGDIGKVALWKPTDFACYIQNSVHKLTPKENLYASFLQYLISYISSTGYFMTVVSAISIAHLTKEKLAETPLLIPPLSEQRAIADYLDKKTSEIDSAISSLEAQRDDLNALKQSIISEAVTGKIDLRDWNSDK